MCSLSDFPEPVAEDQVASCEIDGKLHCSKPGHADVHVFTSSVSSHPVISIVKEHAGAPTAKMPSADFFLPPSDSLAERLQNAWYEDGLRSVLEVLSTCDDHRVSQTIASSLLSSIDLVRQVISNIGITSQDRSGEERGGKDGPVQLLSWHPHCVRLAVLARDDSVLVFSPQGHVSPLLKASAQTSVTCLAWRPLSGGELGVGCREGVYVWSVGDPHAVISRPSINSAVHLSAPGHTHISTLAWNPHGELLASGSRTEGVIWVWSVDRGEHVLLRRFGGNATRLLCWSPDGCKLLAATYTNVFRVWDCAGLWGFECWRGGGCSVVAASFCPTASSLLVFAAASEPFLYCLDSSASAGVFQASSDKPTAKIVADLTLIELSSGTMVGGQVDELSWDATGRHLALTFRASPLVAVFLCVFSPHFHLVPKFFINGEAGEKATCIAFENSFTEGANLTIAWSSGRVQYFPIIYRVEDSTHNIVGFSGSPNQTPNQSSLHYHSF